MSSASRGHATEPAARRALVTGLGREALACCTLVLRRSRLEVDYVANPHQAAASAAGGPYALVIAGFPLVEVSFTESVARIRNLEDCTTSAFVVLAPPDQVRQAARHVGAGINKVLSTEDPLEVLQLAVDRLLAAPSRASLQRAAKLEIKALIDEQWHCWRTEDISSTGMLIRTAEKVEIGRRFRFQIDLPGKGAPIAGDAKVVRQTIVGDSTVAAVGCRFCSFEMDGRLRLAEYLESCPDPQ